MKRNWLTYVAIVATLIAGGYANTTFAGNKGGSNGGSSFRPAATGNFQHTGNNTSSNLGAVRNLGGLNLNSNNNAITTQIKNFNSNGGVVRSGQLNTNQLPKLGLQTTPKLTINPDIAKNLGIQAHGNQSSLLNSDLVKKLGPAVQQGNGQNLINPDIAKKFLGSYNAKCTPGCNPCDPCKKGCLPWWWCPTWYYPCYSPCYPIVYTTPIVIPVATEVVTVGSVVEEKILQVPVGSTITLQGKEFGETAGQVVIQLDKLAMPAMVNEWKNESITATVPMLALSAPLRAEILVVKFDGKVANSLKVELIPAPQNTADASTQATATVR